MRQLFPARFSIFILLVFSLSISACDEKKPEVITNVSQTILIEPAAGTKPIIQAIRNAKQEIDVTMYLFTERHIAQALVDAKQHGVNVKILLEKSPYKQNNTNQKIRRFLINQGINLQSPNLPEHSLLHQKTMIIDGKDALLMTDNFVYTSFKQAAPEERNLLVLDHNPNDIQQLKAVFNADWNHQTLTEIPHGQLIFSPNDSRNNLLKLIASAQKSLELYAPSLSDYQIVGALTKAARRGVKVKVLANYNTLRPRIANYLQKSGVLVHVNNQIFIHAKMIIADHKKVYCGSINFTKPSIDKNREAGIVTDDNDVVRKSEEAFIRDWS